MEEIKKIFHQARRILAKVWLEINLQLTVVGVTGSYGKTSAVRAIAEVLSVKFSTQRTNLNLDTLYNLPITILKTRAWNEVLVLEYGVDHLGEMDFHLSLVKPKIAVLTGITPVHAEKGLLGSLENIVAEKSKLIEAIPEDGLAVFNYDDREVRKIGQGFKGKKLFYGMSEKADIWAENIKITLKGTEFSLHDQKQKLKVKTRLLGYPAISTFMAAYAVAQHLGVERKKILTRLAELKPLEGRFSLEPGPLGTILVNDAKGANPASTLAGLRSLAAFPGRKVAVLGEMGELGEWQEEMHREIGQEVTKLKIDLLIGVGPLTKFMIEEAKKGGLPASQVFWAKDVAEAAKTLRKRLKKGDLFYLKASLLRHLERIILLLQGERVDCQAISCHYYRSCDTCPRRVK
ncbi:MAG TPA: UDP-N-acetylmuramoyl-tripeptide--D-alanyl-D-alanine ligase [Clostridia bacterium]|nr:UDP-N-acetylmuramoyl-tripeptide--D-alanyl-D-alanine ligase [Clostridia bacterium]